MASSNLMVGLEIGTTKICVVVGEGRPDGTIKILGVGQAPSRGVRKGEIVDFETAMKCVHEAVVDAEEKSDIMIRSVYVAVTGAHIASFNNRGCIALPEDRSLRAFLEEGVADGSIEPCDSKIAAFAIAGAVNWICMWYQPEGALAPRDVAAQFARTLTRGVAREKNSAPEAGANVRRRTISKYRTRSREELWQPAK